MNWIDFAIGVEAGVVGVIVLLLAKDLVVKYIEIKTLETVLEVVKDKKRR